MRNKTVIFPQDQRGFTLIELLIALAISAIIGVGVFSATAQVFAVNGSVYSHTIAVKQVELAVDSISRDCQESQQYRTTPPGWSFPLTFIWIDWDNTRHNAQYALVNGNLTRTYWEGASPTPPVNAAKSVVAKYVTSISATYQANPSMITFSITSSVTGYRPSAETRTFKVFPRPVGD
jgi:prepilin-type N-terminal cleavage/methylation domain-containing protein